MPFVDKAAPAHSRRPLHKRIRRCAEVHAMVQRALQEYRRAASVARGAHTQARAARRPEPRDPSLRLLSHLDERLADRLEEETRLRAGVRARSACCRQRSLRPSVSSSKSARGGASLSLLLELVESEVQLC